MESRLERQIELSVILKDYKMSIVGVTPDYSEVRLEDFDIDKWAHHVREIFNSRLEEATFSMNAEKRIRRGQKTEWVND